MPIYQIRLEEQLNQYANLREEALELHKRYQGKTILFQTFAGIATAKLLLVWGIGKLLCRYGALGLPQPGEQLPRPSWPLPGGFRCACSSRQ